MVLHRPFDHLSVPAIVPSWLSKVLLSLAVHHEPLAVHHEPTTIVLGSNGRMDDEPSTVDDELHTMVLCRMSLPVAQGTQGWHTPARSRSLHPSR